MFTEYSDILDKIPEPPQWWDEHRVPGYVEFAPHRVADIYADEAALAEIACFGCLTIYKLACSSLDFEAYERAGPPLAAAIRRGDLQLCDPPTPVAAATALHRLLQPENPTILVPPQRCPHLDPRPEPRNRSARKQNLARSLVVAV